MARIEHYLQNDAVSRQPEYNDTCKMMPAAGGPDLHMSNREKTFFF